MSEDASHAITPVAAAAVQTSANLPALPPDNVEIAVTSEEFDQCVLASIPEDVKPTLQGVFKQNSRHSILAVLLSLAVIAFALMMLWWMMPAPEGRRVASGIKTTGLTQRDWFSKDIFQQADEYYKAEQYDSCIKSCQQQVEKLLKQGDQKRIKDNGLLLHRFFSSVLLGNYLMDSQTHQNAVALSKELYKIDPDTPQWCYFYFLLDFDTDVKWKDTRKDPARLDRARKKFKEWQPMRERMQKFDREKSDYREALLNLELWCAHGPFCDWDMDGDCSECLTAHERVWEIVNASRYDGNIDFLKLRKELLTIIKEKNGFWRHYIIGGERFWGWRACDEKLNDANGRLKSLKTAGEKK